MLKNVIIMIETRSLYHDKQRSELSQNFIENVGIESNHKKCQQKIVHLLYIIYILF